MLLSLVAAINVAAAATLDVWAGKLAAFDEPVVRCAPALPLGKVDNTTATVAMVGYDVPANCVGKTAHTTLYASGGSPLGSGTGTVATPSFTVPLAPAASLAGYFGTALAVGGLQVGVGGSDVSLNIEIDDWSSGYCADVTVSNASAAPISRSVPIALNAYPLNGEVSSSWGSITTSSGQVTVGGTIPGNGSVTGSYCANRTEPPPPASVNYTVTVSPNSVSAYCAVVEVSNPQAVPVTWEIEVDASQWHPNNSTGGSVSSSYGANVSYDSGTSTITASGANHTEVIPVGGSVEWGYCMSGMQAFVPPGATFATTVTVGPSNHWGTGYNASVQVTTDSATDVPWEVDLDMSQYGVTTNLSSGDADLVHLGGGIWRANGKNTAATVSSSSPVTFSISASSVTASTPRVASDADVVWSGSCASVTVTTTSTTWQAWEAVLDLSSRTGTPGAPWHPGSAATSSWNSTTREFRVWGVAGAWHLRNDVSRTFGFCMSG